MAGGLYGDIFILAGLWSAIPALVIAYVFGGRGVAWALLLSGLAALGYLIWTFFSADRSDETFVLLTIPAFWAAAALWACLAYVLIRLVGLLPRQRNSRGKTFL